MDQAFQHDRYLLRKKVFKLFGGAFHIYDPEMQEVRFYAEQKAFKLKEDFTVFGDEGKTRALIKIQARSVIDFSATYDVTDPQSGDQVGSVRRKGLKSMLRDEWEILDGSGNVLGRAKEDSMLLAMVRRLLSNLVPQTFELTDTDDRPLGTFKQSFNPFVFKMELDYSSDIHNKLDRRLGIGVAVCMMAIEGRQG